MIDPDEFNSNYGFRRASENPGNCSRRLQDVLKKSHCHSEGAPHLAG